MRIIMRHDLSPIVIYKVIGHGVASLVMEIYCCVHRGEESPRARIERSRAREKLVTTVCRGIAPLLPYKFR